MYVELTRAEVELADRLVPRLEEHSRQWCWFRWLLLAISIGMLALLPVVLTQSSEPSTSPQLMRLYGAMQAMFLFLGLLGAVLLWMCVLNWRRDVRDSLIAKVLEEKLHDERTARIRASIEGRRRQGMPNDEIPNDEGMTKSE